MTDLQLKNELPYWADIYQFLMYTYSKMLSDVNHQI